MMIRMIFGCVIAGSVRQEPNANAIPNGDANKSIYTIDIDKDNSNKKVDNSYKHLYRKKTKWELCRLSFTMMGAEIVYSLETALIFPLLLMYGMKREHVVLMWAIPPVLGLLFSPHLGSLSDNCHLSLGRRRPFIILLAVMDILGLILVANGYIIGRLFGDSYYDISKNINKTILNEFTNNDPISITNSNDYLHTIVCIVIGTILIDFSTDALLNPSRAYILDVCVTGDYDKGLNISTILAGIGGFIGYNVGSIDWNETFLNDAIGGYGRIVFTLVTGLFVICVSVSVTSFREKPLDKLSSSRSSAGTEDTEITYSKNELTRYLLPVISLPGRLKFVYATNLLCWMSHLNFYFYFTHFVGRSVYEGDPTADRSSTIYQQYEEGIRFACLALSLNCISSILYPLIANRLIEKLGIKQVYMGTILLDTISLCSMTVYRTKIMVVIMSVVTGIVYCTSYTIPYMIVAHHHVNDKDDGKSKVGSPTRGLGTNISIIGTCICMAQLLNSMYMSECMLLFGVTFAVIGTSALLGFCAFLTATQITI